MPAAGGLASLREAQIGVLELAAAATSEQLEARRERGRHTLKGVWGLARTSGMACRAGTA